MTRSAVAVAAACLWAGLAIGQERPPHAPATTPQQDAGATAPRPPVRPDEAQEVTTPAVPAAPEMPDPDRIFGPPPPPRWWQLRETDQDYAACRLALSLLGTTYEELPALTDPEDRDCGIARPIRVSRILPDLTLTGGGVMRCDTARALGFWARDFVRPAAATLPGAPRLTAMQPGTTYDCRARVGTGKARPKISEHALGNAIDIMAFGFDGADPLPVEPRTGGGDQTEAFQRAVRGAACLFFTTVLGPGANDAHANHLHLDLADRRGHWRLCQ